jgi:hypothetical protein
VAPDSEKNSCSNAPEKACPNDHHEGTAAPGSQSSEFVGDITQGFREEIKYYTAQQEEQIKDSLQTVADSQRRYWRGLESRLILWLGVTVIIVVASAGVFGLSDGLVIGAVLLGMVIAGRVYLWTWFVRKRVNRLDMFRKRFRELLDSVNDIRWQTRPEEMVAEDKAFLEKYKDSILFPSVISYDGRERIWPDQDLGHAETLYEEYRSFKHVHPWPNPNDPNSNAALKCELCIAAGRVRKHIEGALSALESHLESQHQKLIKDIDNSNPGGAANTTDFLDDFRERKGFYYVPEDLANHDEKLLAWLNSLGDKQSWTFEDADKVRELCRIREKGECDWLEEYEQKHRFDLIVDKLTRVMKDAAMRSGLTDTWDWFDSARDWLAEHERVIAVIRRILGRRNPEAMFRELEEEERFVGIAFRLPGITKWGYDPKLVAKERRTARKLATKERDGYDRERSRELHAMQAFLQAERHERE